MKRNLSFCFLLALLTVASASNAQSTGYQNSKPVYITGTTLKLKENILVGFNSRFAGANNARWFQHENNFLVKFTMDGLEQRAMFDKKARLIYTISYGFEKNLPTDVRKTLKSLYVEFNIGSAIKILEAGRTIWVVSVEDENDAILVRVEDREFEEVQKYRKATTPKVQPTLLK